MTFQITPEALGILIMGCIVGIAVFKYAVRTHGGLPARGDLVGAISAAVGVIAALGLLLGLDSSRRGSAPVPEAPSISGPAVECPTLSPDADPCPSTAPSPARPTC
ncbi:hypothetical protein [Streptomyces sp. NPDC088178]|uniref:hypothetical protein n=1 Tax=Streptomyces sp. NPDC088178 TaxID=3365836 RepID=UPI00381010F1